MRARTPTSALACLAIAASTPALGGPILFTWDGNNDGNYNGFYSEALDWNPNGVPNGYVEARWDATPNSYTVIFTSDRTVEIATVIDPQLTLISNAGGPQYTFHATDFRVGEFPTYAHSVKVFELEIDIANELLLEYGGDMFLGGTAGPNGDMVCETLTLNGPSSCILSANGSTSSATVNGSAFVRNFSTLSATNDGDVTVGDTLDLEGTLSVNSGGTATIGTLNAKVDTPTISVSGSGSQLRAVKADFDDATVNVLDSGALVLLAGPGQHWIQQGTSLTVDTGGLFYVYGDLRLDTPLDLLANATLYVDGGVEVCLNWPGRINHSATLTQALPAVYDVNSNTTIDVATDLRFGGGSTMLVGGNVEVGRYFDIATVGVVGATGVYFFGSTASLMVNATGQSWWGRSGHSAEIEFNFGATANVPGGVELAHSVNDGTTGFIDVTVGSVLTLGTLEIAALGGATTWGQAAVTGNNSEIIQTGAASLIVGHSSTGTAIVYILDNGKFTTGTGQTVIHPTGRITLDNGTLDVNGSFTCNGQLTGTGTVIIGGTVVNGGLCGPFHHS